MKISLALRKMDTRYFAVKFLMHCFVYIQYTSRVVVRIYSYFFIPISRNFHVIYIQSCLTIIFLLEPSMVNTSPRNESFRCDMAFLWSVIH